MSDEEEPPKTALDKARDALEEGRKVLEEAQEGADILEKIGELPRIEKAQFEKAKDRFKKLDEALNHKDESE